MSNFFSIVIIGVICISIFPIWIMIKWEKAGDKKKQILRSSHSFKKAGPIMSSGYKAKIKEWQKAQNESYKNIIVEKEFTKENLLSLLNEIILSVKFSHISDESIYGKTDYWSTSNEVMDIMAGDCEDYAILMLIVLKEYGIREEKLGVSIATLNGGKQAHGFCIIHFSNEDLYVFDNGAFCKTPIHMKDFCVKNPDVIFEVGFNSIDSWEYEAIGV